MQHHSAGTAQGPRFSTALLLGRASRFDSLCLPAQIPRQPQERPARRKAHGRIQGRIERDWLGYLPPKQLPKNGFKPSEITNLVRVSDQCVTF
jgi:hypothetical protein